MRIEDFNERLKQGILVGDGAMGSLLYDAVGQQRSVDELNSIPLRGRISLSPGVYRGGRAAH